MATYIPNDVYDRIVNSIAALGTHRPDAIKIALGEDADCWPDRIRFDVALTLSRDLEAKQSRLRTHTESQTAIRGFSDVT